MLKKTQTQPTLVFEQDEKKRLIYGVSWMERASAGKALRHIAGEAAGKRTAQKWGVK